MLVFGDCDHEAETKFHTDGSSAGLGDMLIQMHHGAERVIVYGSGTLTEVGKNIELPKRSGLH